MSRPSPSSNAVTASASPAAGLRVAIVASAYHASVVGPMVDGARRAFVELGGDERGVEQISAPGAFELPVLAAGAARSRRFDAVVTLGCIIKGETRHDEVIAHAVAGALAGLSVETGVPVAFGVLTVDTVEQALARAGGACGNKGEEAMRAAVEAVSALRALAAGSRRAGAMERV